MPFLTKDQSCGTCAFCERSKQLGQGKCRRGPPTAVALPMKGPLGAMGIQQIAFYPPVTLSDRGCGEYEKALELEEDDSAASP